MKEIFVGFCIGFALFTLCCKCQEYYNERQRNRSRGLCAETSFAKTGAPIVMSNVETNTYFSRPYGNCEMYETVIVRRREVYEPKMVKGHWVTDENGNRLRYVDSHIEYR